MRCETATPRAARRSRRFLAAKDFRDEVRYKTLDWPGKTTRLERDSMTDVCQRPTAAQPAIAELYHENSKLFAAMVDELTANRIEVEGIRAAAAAQRSRAMDAGGWAVAPLPEPAMKMLDSAFKCTPTALLFTSDIRVLVSESLAIFDPVESRAYSLKNITEADVKVLERAVTLLANSATPVFDGALIFLVSSFARNQMLYGARGYRRALTDAGELIGHIQNRAADAGFGFTIWREFADRPIDALVEADGIEEGTIAIIELRQGGAHGDDS